MLLQQRYRSILVPAIFVVYTSVFGTPPSIDPDTNSIIVNSGLTLTLICTGTSNLIWKPPSNSSDTAKKINQYSIKNNHTNNYENKLKITNITFSDTGYYYCSYERTSRRSLEFTNSIYVFVHDVDNLLAPFDTYKITISFHHENIIPCRPSSPEVRITLKKRNQVVSTNYKDVLFDNRVGFIILYPTEFYSGMFMCMAELNGKREVKPFYLTLNDKNEEFYLPTPRIDLNSNVVVTFGEKIVFSCLIYVPTKEEYFLTWDYPNKQNHSRISQGPQNSTVQTSKNNVFDSILFFEIVRNITIEGAEYEDEGIYECVVTKRRHKRNNTASTYVTVCENDTATLKLEADFNDKICKHKVGERKTFVVSVQTKPGQPVELKWLKNNQIFDCTEANSCNITTNSDQTSITFFNYNLNDSATYTLIAKGRCLQKSINFTLRIIDKPSVTITPTDVNYIADKEYIITCSVYAIPKANVSWTLSLCATESCQRKTVRVSFLRDPNKEHVRTISDGWYVKSILTLKAKRTGYYTCVASNEWGTSQKELLLIVTDAVNNSRPIGFGFVNFNHSPRQNDRFKIECRASKFNFTSKSLKLQFQPKNDERDPTLLQNKTGLTLTTTESSYTYGIIATFDSIKQVDDGSYSCIAFITMQQQTSEHFENLTILLQPRALKVEFTNMDGSVHSVESYEQFRFICNVSGFPYPTTTWTKNNKAINSTTQTQFNFIGNVILEIPWVTADDMGLYSCVVTNGKQLLTLSSTLTVTGIGMVNSIEISSITYGLLAAIIALVIIIVVILLVIFIRKCKTRKKQRKKTRPSRTKKLEKNSTERYNQMVPLVEQFEKRPCEKRRKYPRS